MRFLISLPSIVLHFKAFAANTLACYLQFLWQCLTPESRWVCSLVQIAWRMKVRKGGPQNFSCTARFQNSFQVMNDKTSPNISHFQCALGFLNRFLSRKNNGGGVRIGLSLTASHSGGDFRMGISNFQMGCSVTDLSTAGLLWYAFHHRQESIHFIHVGCFASHFCFLQ